MDTIQQVLGEYDYNEIPLQDDVAWEVFLTFAIVFGIILVFILLVAYVFTALTLYKTAQRLKHPKPWLAWIPFANIYLQLELGDMNTSFLLLYIAPIFVSLLSAIPYIGFIFSFLSTGVSVAIIVVNTITFMNISEKRGYDRELGLMSIAPLTSWILRGILAWGKKGSEN